MNDNEIKPVSPVRGVKAIGPVGLRRRPGLGQLRQWLAFSKRLAKRKQKQEEGG